MASGFYVPGSISGLYVANKRNESGSLIYESAANEIDIQKQAAFQSLNRDYSTTIENAYSQYLSSRQGVLGSAMGQGYKDAYVNAQQQALMQQVAQANTNAATARQQLTTSAEEAKGQVQQAYQTEVANFDRAVGLMNNYLTYLKGLSLTPGEKDKTDYSNYTDEEDVIRYLDKTQMPLSLDDLYDVVYSAQPQGYTDESGNAGLSMLDWIHSNLDFNSTADSSWYQWFTGTGKAEMEKELAQPLAVKRQQEIEDTKRKEQEAEEAKRTQIEKEAVMDTVIPSYVEINSDNRDNIIINGQLYRNTIGYQGLYNEEGKEEQRNISNKFTELTNKDPKTGDIIKYHGIYWYYTGNKVSGNYWNPLTQGKRKPTASGTGSGYGGGGSRGI